MAGSRCAVGYYNREKLLARIHPSLLPPQLHTRKHTHTHTLMMHTKSGCPALSLSVSRNMIRDGLIQLIDEQSGRAAGGGGSRAAWDRRGEDCINRERTGGREGVGSCVAVCYSGMELAARHPVWINVCVCVCE